jgi:hypothetical protein
MGLEGVGAVTPIERELKKPGQMFLLCAARVCDSRFV